MTIVDNRPQDLAKTSGRSLRRFPHLTRADVELLEQLEPDAARAFEAFLRQQHRGDREHRARQTPEADLGNDALERLHARRSSRWSHGPGGGRQRHLPPEDRG